jgi:hypothetical protein
MEAAGILVKMHPLLNPSSLQPASKWNVRGEWQSGSLPTGRQAKL